MQVFVVALCSAKYGTEKIYCLRNLAGKGKWQHVVTGSWEKARNK